MTEQEERLIKETLPLEQLKKSDKKTIVNFAKLVLKPIKLNQENSKIIINKKNQILIKDDFENNKSDEFIESKKNKKNSFGYSLKNVPDYSKINSDYVKKLRKKLNLSEKNLASLIGVLEDTVVSWENGIKQPKSTTSRLLYILYNNPEVTTNMFVLKRN